MNPTPLTAGEWTPSHVELERRQLRRRASIRSTIFAALSTLLFAVVIWVVLANSQGWPVFQRTFFAPEYALQALPRVWQGFLLNLRVLVVAAIGVFVLGMLLALMRTLRAPVFFPLRVFSTVYTDVFRGTPLIIVLYLVGFGIPALRIYDGYLRPEILGTIALIVTYSAYVSEVFRAGIDAVHPSQRMAARAMGLGYTKTMRLIVLPQALRKVTPPLMNDFVAMQKDVGLISVLGAVDAVRAAQIETAGAANFTPYVVAGLLFVALAIPTTRLADWYTDRLRKREQIGSVL